MDKARFLENLTKERKKRSLTQKELADALGISDKTYSKWETGENEPDVETLCRLAAFYGESPAVFFREGEESPSLEGMPAAEAAEICWRRINDLLQGLKSAAYPPAEAPAEPLPPPEMPQSLVMPEVDRSHWLYNWQDVFALTAAGPDLNLAMLLMPHVERYAWLSREGADLEALFRFLGLPGAVRCLYAMITEEQMSFFSPAYLAEKAGVTEEEATAVLEQGQAWQLAYPQPCLGREGPVTYYRGGMRVPMLGLLSLARLMLAYDPARGERRGTILSGNGNVTLPKNETVDSAFTRLYDDGSLTLPKGGAI